MKSLKKLITIPDNNIGTKRKSTKNENVNNALLHTCCDKNAHLIAITVKRQKIISPMMLAIGVHWHYRRRE